MGKVGYSTIGYYKLNWQGGGIKSYAWIFFTTLQSAPLALCIIQGSIVIV